jgi:maltose O-acetyltransferase
MLPSMHSQKHRMLAGMPYRADDPQLQAEQAATRAWLARYNALLAATPGEWHALLRERMGAVGDGAVVRPPFHCDYGYNIHLGEGVFLNHGCVVLDVAEVVVGDRAQLGPLVQLYAADHPRDVAQRRAGWESGRAVRIGADAWIGGGAILLPGVTVGDGAIVGAGSVVTRDVPAGATIAGNPARRLR